MIYLCYRYGRKKALMISLAVQFVVTLVAIWLPTYELFAITRFLNGACVAGAFTSIFVLGKPFLFNWPYFFSFSFPTCFILIVLLLALSRPFFKKHTVPCYFKWSWTDYYYYYYVQVYLLINILVALFIIYLFLYSRYTIE